MKPANVVIGNDSNEAHFIYLIDFGLAKKESSTNPPIDTWSSFAPLVDNESVDDGCTSTLFSDTSAAAVQCAIMNPEWKPPFLTKNAGKPLKSGLHKR